MDLKLKEKSVVITGGTSGIGLATACEFAKEGCKIAICGRNSEKLAAAKKRLEEFGVKLYTQVLNITDISALQSFAENVYKTLGSIDVWVNNAGVSFAKPLLDCSEEDWNNVVDTDLKAVFFASQTAAKYMKQTEKGGVIINVSSFGAIIPRPDLSIYTAAKSGVLNLTKSLAGGLAPFGIRSVAVIPGSVETEMLKPRFTTMKKESLLEDISARRLAQPEEIAKPIVFLASDASSYISGVALEISGGKLAVQKPYLCWQ